MGSKISAITPGARINRESAGVHRDCICRPRPIRARGSNHYDGPRTQNGDEGHHEHDTTQDSLTSLPLAVALAGTWAPYTAETLLDSGCSRSVFRRVNNPRGCQVKLHGIGSTFNITKTGDIGSIPDVLEHPGNPVNLVSLGQLLERGPWTSITFEKSSGNSIKHKVWGTLPADNPYPFDRVLLAYRNTSTRGLYRCTRHISRDFRPTNEILPTSMVNMVHVHVDALSSQHTEEVDSTIKFARALGFPSTQMLRKINKDPIHGLKLTKRDISRYDAMPNEARLVGGQKKPVYTGSKGRGPEGRPVVFLEELHADSKELPYTGVYGEKYSFDIYDLATGTEFTILHKNFLELPELIDRFIINTLDDARRRKILADPRIRRFRLDGHPSQLSTQPQVIAAVERVLLKHQIASNGISPGLSRQMGHVGKSQQGKARVAASIFHDSGQGMPTKFYSSAYIHSSTVRDFWEQSGHNGKSSFELREGRPWTVADLPVAWGSTGYFKDLATVGAKNKQGSSGVGVVIGYRPALMALQLWVPSRDTIIIRAGVALNQRFSSFKSTRVADMRAGRVVHRMSDAKNTTRVTRADTTRESALQLEPVAEQGIIKYYIAKLGGEPIEKPYCCADKHCIRHKPLNGFETLRGLKRHITAKLKRAKAAADALVRGTSQENGGRVCPQVPNKANEDLNPEDGPRRVPGEANTGSGGADTDTGSGGADTDAGSGGADTDTGAGGAENSANTAADKTPSTDSTAATGTPTKRRSRKKLTRKKTQLRRSKRVQESETANLARIESIRHGTGTWRELYDVHRHKKKPDEQVQIDFGTKLRKIWNNDMGTYYEHAAATTVETRESAETPEEIQRKYDSIPYEQDRSPPWDPHVPHVTLRSFLGIADEDAAFFDDTCKEYITPDIFGSGWEVEGFHTRESRTILAPDGRPLLTLENCDFWTPKFAHEVKNSPYKKEIYDAMNKETSTLNDYKSFLELAKAPAGKRLITLKWVYKIKFKNGVFDKFKARLVGRGFTQIEGVDYDPEGTSSPVARNSTFMATMAEATAMKHFLYSFDVKSAYLLADLTEEVYARVPYGMYVDPKTQCLRILKSLYGLKQSGYNWFSKLSNNLREIGFEQSTVDPCFFNLRQGGEICRICIWVDDGLVSVSSEELWHEIKAKIHAGSPLSAAGPLEWLLGMAITHDRESCILQISQATRIGALLERYGMHKCKGVKTPLPEHEKITTDDCPTNEAGERAVARECGFNSYMNMISYIRELIGAFGYLACWGRPDIRFATYFMARYQSRPTKRHFQLVKRMLRYLQQTKDLQLTFDPTGSAQDLNTLRLPDNHPLYGMVDSNYTGADDTKSTTGYVFWFYGCPIVCESKKQKAITHSTTEAELIAASLAARRCNYLRRLLTEDFGINLPSTPLGEDNQGAIEVSRGGGSHAKMRHIRTADSYIWQEFKINKTIDLRYVASADNISDMFTKALGPVVFTRLRNILMRNHISTK